MWGVKQYLVSPDMPYMIAEQEILSTEKSKLQKYHK